MKTLAIIQILIGLFIFLEMDRIAYVIVTFNGENHIECCIKSIKKFHKDAFIIIVDNNSQDNTVALVKKLDIDKLIESKENLGFGKANNLALEYVVSKNFEFCFLLNQDVYFLDGDFENFVYNSKIAFQENYAIVSPLHLSSNKKDFDYKFVDYISKKNTPGLIESISENKNLNNVYNSKAINAAAWLISKDTILKIGLFDPLFPHYGEDTDYINRVYYHKKKIGVIPNFKIVHNRSQIENFQLKDFVNRLKIWSLVYLKNINIMYLFLLFNFPFQLFKRTKKINYSYFKQLKLFVKVLFFSQFNILRILKSRRVSKQTKAFLE